MSKKSLRQPGSESRDCYGRNDFNRNAKWGNLIMSIVPQHPSSLDQNDQPAVCSVCGAALEEDGDIEDSNGWRWFSDGRGGLLPLCPTCPVPTDIGSAF